MKPYKRIAAALLVLLMLLPWSFAIGDGETTPEGSSPSASGELTDGSGTQPETDEDQGLPAVETVTLALLQEDGTGEIPSVTETAGEENTTAPGLKLDNGTVYQGMEKSYAQGYVPTVTKTGITIVLPIKGDTQGQVIHVQPELNADGPYVYGNYEFDVNKTNEQDVQGESHSVFLVRLELPLKKTYYNGSYQIPFIITYTGTNGEERSETYQVTVSITTGRNRLSGGGGGGAAVVKKPVILLTEGSLSKTEVAGGESFTLHLALRNSGDRDATNVRVQVLQEDPGIELKGSLNGTYIGLLVMEGSAEVTFSLGAVAKAEAGPHIISAEISFEDKYGGSYTEKYLFRVDVRQPARIGFDEVHMENPLTAGTSFIQPFCVYNTGYAEVYNVRCSIECDGLIASSAYLGNLSPQQSAEKAVTVYVTPLTGSQRYGDTYGNAVFYYEDENGTQYAETSSIRVTIQEPEKKTDEQKKAEEEKIARQETVSQWWISLLLGIAAIAVLVCIIVVGKLTRALKMK